MGKKQQHGGQISRFYQTELLSSEECGVFLTNVEIAKISTDMGFEITFTSNEFIISELFKEASDANKLEELNENLLSIFESRLAEYNTIKKLYPKAQKPVSIWIDRCQKTIEKIRNGAN